MASRAIDDRHWTLAEYLEWEDQQPEKYELMNGIVYRRNREARALIGVTIRHGQTVTNIQAALKAKLRGTGCRAYGPEVRLHLSASDDIFYPDVFIACSKAAESEREVLDAAVVIMEVISQSTGAYDRGPKLHAYIGLPSLLAYVLIDPNGHEIETFTREDGRWVLREVASGSALVLPGVDVTLTWDEIFDEVDAKFDLFAPADIVAPPPEVLSRRKK